MPKVEVALAAMSNPHDYRVRFFDSEGVLIEDVALPAESLVVATDRAEALGAELGAVNFYITSKPDAETGGRVASATARPASARSAKARFWPSGPFGIFSRLIHH